MNKFINVLVLTFIVVSCQHNPAHGQVQKQKVFFNGLEVEIPADWEYEKNNQSFRSREKNSRNTLTINFMNLDVDTKFALLEAKKMSNGNDFFDNAEFTEIRRGTFGNFPSSEISFSGTKEGKLLKGTLMTFRFENEIVFLTYMGEEDFIEGNILSDILLSIQVN